MHRHAIPADVRALSAHVLTTATSRQRHAFQQLIDSGWLVRAWTVSDFMDHLLIDGRDNFGDAFRGHIDVNGNLQGEPADDDQLPGWLTHTTTTRGGGVREMTGREHARQRDLVRLAIQLDPARAGEHRQRPAVRTRVAAPVLDSLEALFSL